MELWFREAHTPNVKLSIRVDKQLYSGQSEFQRIDVFDSQEFGRFLTLDGYMMLTEKDEFIYHEMMVHIPMAVHPNVKDVLVIGGGDGGVVRELCRYPEIEHIDLVEIDPQVVEVCRRYLPFTTCSLDDPRVSIHYEDGLRYVRTPMEQYDLIIVDSTDPFGPCALTASWSTSMRAPSIRRTPLPVNGPTSGLWSPSPWPRCTRPTSPPTPPATGSSVLPARSTTPCGTWTRSAGTPGSSAADTTPPCCTRARSTSPPT